MLSLDERLDQTVFWRVIFTRRWAACRNSARAGRPAEAFLSFLGTLIENPISVIDSFIYLRSTVKY